MSQATATRGGSPRAAFEEPIFVKYSPHHELPLSTVSSVGLHALVVGLLIVAGIIIARMNWNDHENPIPTDVVLAGGGGGNPQGADNGPGSGAVNPPERQEPPLADRQDHQPIDPVRREGLIEIKGDLLQLQGFEDPQSERLVEQGNQAVIDRWLRLQPQVRDQLKRALGKGKDGPGSGGGDGTGKGPGNGGKEGPGTGTADRMKRSLRWELVFNTRDGRDYKRQLKAFGAILAFADPDNPGGYLVIRDLDQERPQAKPEDIGQIDRIYWIDDGRASVESLSAALGLVKPPARFFVFFSRELEENLLKLELAYHGWKESDILETRFDVRKRGDTYEPVVVTQRRQ
jgi:hypothetical protein